MPKFVTNHDETGYRQDGEPRLYQSGHVALEQVDEIRKSTYGNAEDGNSYPSILLVFDGNWSHWIYRDVKRRDTHYDILTRYSWLPQFVLNRLLKK